MGNGSQAGRGLNIEDQADRSSSEHQSESRKPEKKSFFFLKSRLKASKLTKKKKEGRVSPK